MQKDELKKEWEEEEKEASIVGWDFSHIEGRYEEGKDIPWDYGEIIKSYLVKDMKLLDIDTGGGEFLLSLNHPYKNTYVTEGYEQNYKLCKEHLAPMGITVKRASGAKTLPYDNDFFDIVINRHGDYNAKEIERVLKKGGLFITQQVGALNDRELVDLLYDSVLDIPFPNQFLDIAVNKFIDEGFSILSKEEFFGKIKFYDVKALVWFACIIKWEFPNFSVDKCLDGLYKAQSIIDEKGYLEAETHRFILVAKK